MEKNTSSLSVQRFRKQKKIKRSLFRGH